VNISDEFLRILKAVRVLKILRALKLKSFIERFFDNIKSRELKRALNLIGPLIYLGIISHFFACLSGSIYFSDTGMVTLFFNFQKYIFQIFIIIEYIFYRY
jgi:hypothetical protein